MRTLWAIVLALGLGFTATAQQQVNNFRVLTNLYVGGAITGTTLNGVNIDAVVTNSAAAVATVFAENLQALLSDSSPSAAKLAYVLNDDSSGDATRGTYRYDPTLTGAETTTVWMCQDKGGNTNSAGRWVRMSAGDNYQMSAETLDDALAIEPSLLAVGINPTNNTKVRMKVYGRSTVNDGAAGDFRKVLTSSVTTNASMVAPFVSDPTYSLERIWDGTTVEAAWFGAFAGDGVADSDAINAALEYVHALGRGVVKLGGGRYDIDKTILIPYRVNLIGTEGWRLVENTSSIVTNSLYLTGGPTQFRLTDGADVDMLWFDSTDGYIRQASETLEDGEVVDSRLQDSMLENIIFFGNAGNQTKHNLRGVAAKSKWTINLRNCGFLSVAGRPLWLFDVNAAVVDDISFTSPGAAYGAKGMFVYSSADNFFGRIYAGGASGPVLWLNSASTFKNVFNSQILFNAQLTNTIWEVASWTTNTLANFSSGLPIDTGEPVEFRTTGGPPTGFTDTQLYFAVKLATNVFGFHTNYALATNGIYLAGSGSAAGTNWLTVGPAAGLYISSGAGQNVFSGLRSDQNSGPGVVIRGGVGNFVSGLEAGENTGAANGETVDGGDQVGVLFDKDSARNRVIGTIYQQPTAFMVRSNAVDNVMEATFTSVSTNFANFSSSANYTSLQRTLGGTATWGESATQTALDLTGNASGVRIVKLARTSGLTQQIGLGVGSDALNVWNETDSRGIALLGNDGTTASYQFGDSSSATPPEAVIYGTAGRGADIAGAAVKIYADQSTGNANRADAFAVLTGDAGSSGSSAQSMTSKFVVEGDGDVRVSANIELGNASDTTLARSVAGVVSVEGVNLSTVNDTAIWVDAGAMAPFATGGAAAATTTLGTTGIPVDEYAFDASAIEKVAFKLAFPSGWNGSTLTAQFYWRTTATSGNCVWTISGRFARDGDNPDTTFGTAQSVTDGAQGTANHQAISSATSTIVPSGTFGNRAVVYFTITRDATNVSDTLASDALLDGVSLNWK